MAHSVLLLPGDGIGPEVIAQARRVLELVAPHVGGIDLNEADFGGIAIDNHGDALPADTLARAKDSDAILLGAVGGPSYDDLESERRPEKGLLRLRSELDVFANIRPVRTWPDLIDSSPLRSDLASQIDLIIVRELIGGIYFGVPRGLEGSGSDQAGFNTERYSVAEVSRIAKVSFDVARRSGGKLCSVDKANVLESSVLWRKTLDSLAAGNDDVDLTHMYVDNAAMQLALNPGQFDVVLTSNMFGDILSDLAAALSGSIGVAPSASLNEAGRGLYEPVHGSAPDIAGTNKANPCAAILSVAMMMRFSLDAPHIANAIEEAVDNAFAAGLRTADIAAEGEKAVSCSDMCAGICAHLKL